MVKVLSEEERSDAQGMLISAACLQHEFWSTLRALECILDVEIDSNVDLDLCTLDDLMEKEGI